MYQSNENDFGLAGLFTSGDTATKADNMFVAAPSSHAPALNGITDAVSSLWDDAKEMITEGAQNIWGANVDNYVSKKEAETEAERMKILADARATPSVQYMSAPSAGFDVMGEIKKNPMIAAGLAFMAFKLLG